MTDAPPILLWFRRDLRLDDNPMLAAAAADGRPLIPVFVADGTVDAMGAAPRWRLGLGLQAFSEALAAAGSRLILRRGEALAALGSLIAESGAGAVWWGRLYDPAARARDGAVKAALKAAGIEARSFPGHVLHEPWEVVTGSGGFYRVYTPFWRAVRDREVPAPAPAPARLCPPARWPASERLEEWRLGAGMARGAAVVRPHLAVGEAAAAARLARFLDGPIAAYAQRRNRPDLPATSRLSENLTLGEIGIRRVWHGALAAHRAGASGAETFLRELVWRDFAWHLAFHTPGILEHNWKPEWDSFPWQADPDRPEVVAWQRGRTGVPFVDAAMRELYVTGTMHNRARMIVASFLTKHLMTHWRIGRDWFADCLVDWDPASNAMGWQWTAGSGPDAAPYFRVFNPETQAEKFDPEGRYRRAWIAELSPDPPPTARDFFRAIPPGWGMAPDDPYPAPIVPLEAGRARALAAYAARAG
jgi:deoxyribodipyrimidine photo-lyase